MSNLYTNIFDPNRADIWDKLKSIPIIGTLGGGTAIALQLGHRISYDFDIFLQSPVPNNLLRKVKTIFPDAEIRPQIDSSDELTFLLDGVKITYLYYPFPPLYPTIKTNSLPLFDLRDSAADKAYTIGRRGAWRDYYDLYFLCTVHKLSLAQIISDAEKKFGDLFSAKLFLEQLTYSGDITDFSIEPLGDNAPASDVIFSYFATEAEKLV